MQLFIIFYNLLLTNCYDKIVNKNFDPMKRLRNTVLHRSCVHRSKRNIIARTCYQFRIRFGNSKSGAERVDT